MIKKVRGEIKSADIIIPTLNSSRRTYNEKLINRPKASISFKEIKEGIKALGDEFKGKIYLETFIIEGINDTGRACTVRIFSKDVNYTKLQLNRLDRPGTEKWVLPASMERLEFVKNFLEEKGLHDVEILGKFHIDEKDKIEKNEELLENMKSKRIYSEEEIEAIYK